MNFVGIIGIVKQIVNKPGENPVVTVKVNRPFSHEKMIDDLKVVFNAVIFKNEISALKKNMVIGIKGRIEEDETAQLLIVGERIQLF